MSFLAPLFLLGGLAVALPVLFHLIRRTTKEQMPFSSLMFLKPVPPRMTKRSRLEHILLLLLRCLVICLLAFAFARPFVQKPLGTDPEADTGRKIIVLVDNGASMKREGLWADALDRAKAALKEAGPGDQVAVMTFDSRARTLISFDQWAAMGADEHAAVTATRLAAVSPTWHSTQLGNALIAAAEAFADADKQGQNIGRRQIILVADMHEGSRLDGLQGYDWPRGVDVEVQTVEAKHPTNAGLQWIVENDEAARAATNPLPRIRVSNSSDSRREQFQIRWDGITGAAPLDVYVPPGQSRIVTAPVLPTNAIGSKIVLTGDDEDFDNQVYVLNPGVEHVNLLTLGDEAENDPTRPLYYLTRAFQETPGQVIQIKTRAPGVTLAPADLADTRLLVTMEQLSDNQLASAQDFMTGGGTVLLVMTNTTAAADVGRLAGVGALSAEEVAPPSYAMLGTVDFSHPLFAQFADARYNDFTKIHFWKYRRLETAKLTGARVLAKFDNGDPAFLEIPRGKGRLLVLTSGWQPADSQFALSSKFVPLLYAVLDLSGGVKPPLTQFHVGDEVNLANYLPAAATTQPVAIRKPDGSEADLASGETRFSQTDTPGIYTIASAQPPARFVVNLDGAESRTAVLPPDELARLGVPMKARDIPRAVQVAQQRRLHETELEQQQKLWRWLTLAALVVLLGETWVAGWLTSRAVSRTEVTI